jgi:hypothetical protein
MKRDYHEDYKAPYETLYKMLNSYRKREHNKPANDPTRKPRNYNTPLDHRHRFECLVRRLLPERQRIDKKLGPRSKSGCMIVGYIHDSTTTWSIWDPDFKTTRTQSDVIFNKERNAYISCPQSVKAKHGLKETTKINIFDLPQVETNIEKLDSGGMDEEMDHGRT